MKIRFAVLRDFDLMAHKGNVKQTQMAKEFFWLISVFGQEIGRKTLQNLNLDFPSHNSWITTAGKQPRLPASDYTNRRQIVQSNRVI